MSLNTLTVGAAVIPTVIETCLSHYLNRKPLRQKPTAHISYHEGIALIKRFLYYASHHTVEDIQAFTSQWVPSPRWVRVDEVTIPEHNILEAAEALQQQLGHHGIDRVGGKTWWQWRRPRSVLKAEWIEMRGDYNERKRTGTKCTRVMLYVHGGAYFFGSVDEHRYQMQRYARKLKARVFAPRYRLAPQFPFPCGLHDCISAYMYLLTVQDPSTIILAGDSAGAGMIVSLLVTLRDQGVPAPAGAILISPWVDLTHSFPSVDSECPMDYIPTHGFLQKPSASWPPPNADDMVDMIQNAITHEAASIRRASIAGPDNQDAVQGFSVDQDPDLSRFGSDGGQAAAGTAEDSGKPGNTVPGPGHDLSIMIDGAMVHIKDQIQMYATNQLISHPLVSPILQPSLGGLPPLLILTGGGEVLRDEQIYLAHKAANPTKYPPGDAYLDLDATARETISKWKGTYVQLQVWEDCCHVTPTLSFTRPAKFMYRSAAQFGAWALARAQKTDIDIQDDGDVSVISSGSDTSLSADSAGAKPTVQPSGTAATAQVGRAGDPLPPFRNHMIRERVDRNGNIYALEPASSLPALQVPAAEIGVIKPGPVGRWMKAKQEWDTKFARQKRSVQQARAKEMEAGYQSFGNDEVPPPSALAGRRGKEVAEEAKKGRSWGMSLWSVWGSKHDEKTIAREEKADRDPATEKTTTTVKANGENGTLAHSSDPKSKHDTTSRSRSRRRVVSDAGQTSAADTNGIDSRLDDKSKSTLQDNHDSSATETSTEVAARSKSPTSSKAPTIGGSTEKSASGRPYHDGIAYPFKLARPAGPETNPSTITLTSTAGAVTPLGVTDADRKEGNAADAATKKVAVEQGELVEASRPEPTRFVTAGEGL
ncbi:MAG: hypothetical protein M1825_005522 [Sarcosagium campestre]|nr:MAG: hypothetical protein M1825_005522 [Sarcosagium campestre]